LLYSSELIGIVEEMGEWFVNGLEKLDKGFSEYVGGTASFFFNSF